MNDIIDDTVRPWLNAYDQNVPKVIETDAKPVFSLLEDAHRDYGDDHAFDFLGMVYSWTDIYEEANRFALGLQKKGIQKGDRVALFLPNCPYYLIAYYGILKIGAVVVNLNPLYSESELAHKIRDSGAKAAVTVDLKLTYEKMFNVLEDSTLETLIICSFTDALPMLKALLFNLFKFKDIAKAHNDPRIVSYDMITENDGISDVPEISPKDDLAVLQYTGGTTGVPKAAMLTHANIYFNTMQSVFWFLGNDYKEVLKEKPQQIMLGVLPFFHVFAMTAIMNFSVRCGFKIIATPRFDLEETLKIIDKKRPHYFPAVPAIYNAIANHKSLDRYDLSSVEFCISGGAPLPVDTKRAFERITGCTVVEGYGLSEASPVVCINPLKGDNLAGSIGLPVPNTIVELIDPEDPDTPVALGEKGELCVRGPQVMKGYWEKPEATAQTIINGRLHTGDVAIMDERGYFFIVDRLKDMIISNGYKIYPRNVEEAIYEHEAVEECIVAGISDKKRGEAVKAWVKVKDGHALTEEDLQEFLKSKISKLDRPRIIEFRDEPLPKTMIGKLSRKMILEEEKRKA